MGGGGIETVLTMDLENEDLIRQSKQKRKHPDVLLTFFFEIVHLLPVGRFFQGAFLLYEKRIKNYVNLKPTLSIDNQKR